MLRPSRCGKSIIHQRDDVVLWQSKVDGRKNKVRQDSDTPYFLYYAFKSLETWVLNKIWVLAESCRRIREEVVDTLLESYFETCILCFMSMNDV